MTKSSRKNIFVWLFAAICFVCSIFSFAFLGKKTEAASAASESTLEMVGASIRTSEMDGIRFIAKIDESEFASYGDAKRFGMILIPEDKYDGSQLTVAYSGGEYVASDEDALVIEGGKLWSDALKAEYEIDDGYVAFSCALIADQEGSESAVRFPKELYNRPLTAVAFIIPESGATVYTQNVTRSMAYVALVESLKSGYEGNPFIEDIVDEVTADLSVNGGLIDNTKTAYEPVLTIGGLDAKASSLVSVSYASNNTAVAKIVDGKVQAVADGTATITATVSAGGTAQFTATEQLTVELLKATVTATSENTAKGTVTGGGTVEQGTSVTLKATAKTGYTFDGWYDGSTKVSSSATYTFTATSNITLQAKWKANTYKVTLTAGTGGAVSGAGTYDYNTKVTITATPNTGYDFTKWSDGNTSASRTITVTAAVNLTATFTAKNYTITATAATAGGTVTGSGSYSYNTQATVRATTNSGYTFLGWYNSSDTKVDSAENYTFTVKNALTLKAKWKAGSLTPEEKTWRDTQGYNYWYFTQLGTDVMPIGAWSSPPPATPALNYNTDQITVANYNTLKASGINAIYGLYDVIWSNEGYGKDNTMRALECAEETGMVYIVRDGNAYEKLSEAGTGAWSQFEQYMTSSAYGGTLFVDEPGYEKFDEIGSAMELWKDNEVYGDNKLALVNNLPIYATAPQLYYGITSTATPPVDYTGANFENWVRAYISTVKPQVYSYDFYPYYGYGNTIWDGYYENLSVVRKVCNEYNVPFWTFNQAGSAFGSTRTLTYAETAMQVHNSLAYGAKGIQWFNYWQPMESGSDAKDLCGIVDMYGNKTVYYNQVQKINAQVAAVDHVLMKSKSLGIFPIGEEPFYGAIPSRDVVGSSGALISASGTGSAIIGCFQTRNEAWSYYIASTSITEDSVVTLNFNTLYDIDKIQDATKVDLGVANSVTVTVPAGEGVLITMPRTVSSGTTYEVTVGNNNANAGTAQGTGTYGSGAKATVVAVPKPGYKFLGWWNEGNVLESTSANYTLTISSNKTLTAHWIEDNSPKMLNDCEVVDRWISLYPKATTTPTLSTEHVRQGSYSVKVSNAYGGLVYLRLGEHALTLSELQSTYKTIAISVYSTYPGTSNHGVWLGNFDGSSIASISYGDNILRIPTSSLTEASYADGVLTLSFGGGDSCDLYFDNVVAMKSTVMLNDAETAGIIVSDNATASQATRLIEGNYSTQLTYSGGGGNMNIRILDGYMTLDELKATFSTITLTIYTDYVGGQGLFYTGTSTAVGTNATTGVNGVLQQGSNTIVINTADIPTTGSGYFVSWNAGWLSMTTYANSTIRIDNVVGTLK